MRRDPQSLTDYLQIIDQRRLYQEHVRHLLTAKPSIDTSPIPMNESIKKKQQQNAMNRVFKFQLEEDKLKFVNDLQEYNKQNKSTSGKLKSSFRKKGNGTYSSKLPPSNLDSNFLLNSTTKSVPENTNMQNNESLLDPSALIGLASARRSVKAQRKYPKLIEPKTSKKTRKIPMSVQTSPRSNYNNEDDYLSSDVDEPLVYSGYMNNGEFSISIDEKSTLCVE